VKVGIIGCGGIAPLHIEAYRKLKDVSVVGLCDLDLQKAKNLASKSRIQKTFDNYMVMLEKEKLDLVDICTPVSTHADIVCNATKIVPAILVEKPMALNVLECDKMIKEARKNGSKLCIGHKQIFSPNIQRAKLIVDSDAFDLFSFSTTLMASFEILKAYNLIGTWSVSPKQRGIIWEVCCHHAYLQLHFLPDIQEVYAVGGKNQYSVYDDFAVLLRTRDQRFGIIRISWVSHETDVIYEFTDSSGKRIQIDWEFDYFLEKSLEPPFTIGKVFKNFFVDEKRLLKKWTSFALCYLRKKKLESTFNLISDYVDAIKRDLPPPITPEQGRNTVNLLECIEKSLNERRSVSLNQ
jgi:UDP-N-acetylglucosamine 3-dehydrogenase